mgnify:FL=1
MNKLQKTILLATIVVISMGVISNLVDTIKKQKIEIGRLDRNVSALSASEVQYKTKLGDAAVKRQALEMSQKELKKTNADLHKQISALNVRVKDALSASRTITKTVIVETVKVDTINNTPTAEYKDPWNTIRSETVGDSAKLSYVGTDSIVGVVSVKRKKFLFFRWGAKAIEYDLSNKNPKTKINIDIAVKFD